jgi:hypothetical protein
MIQMLHRWCLQDDFLVKVFVLSHGGIALAYLAIPLLMWRFLVQQKVHPGRYLAFWLSAGFILACGITHALAIWTMIGRPHYRLEAAALAVTALISLATAAVLPYGLKNIVAYKREKHDLANQLHILQLQNEKQSDSLRELQKSFNESNAIAVEDRRAIKAGLDRIDQSLAPSIADTLSRLEALVGKLPKRAE